MNSSIIDKPKKTHGEGGGVTSEYVIPKLSNKQLIEVRKVAHKCPEIVAYKEAGGSITHPDTLTSFVDSLAKVVDGRIFSEVRTFLLADGDISSSRAWGEQLFKTYPVLETEFDALFGEGMFSILDDHSKGYFYSFFGAALTELKRERMKSLLEEVYEARRISQVQKKKQQTDAQQERRRHMELAGKDQLVMHWLGRAVCDRSDVPRIMELIYEVDKNTPVSIRDLRRESRTEDIEAVFKALNDPRTTTGTRAFDLRFSRFIVAYIRALRVKRIGATYEYHPKRNELTKRFLVEADGTRHELSLMTGF